MPWPCYIVKPIRGNIFELDGRKVTIQELKPGACWLDDGDLYVLLPNCEEWPVDLGRRQNASRLARDPEGAAKNRLPEWRWTGTLPNITITPSVNCVGRYHGWVQNGVVTDDCEGRKFDEMGKRIP